MELASQAALHFEGPHEVRQCRPLGRGHINDTFLVEFLDGPDGVLQRLNTFVFPNPDAVMDNICRVTEHLAGKLTPPWQSLRVIPTTQGQSLYRDSQGQCWRMYQRVHPCQSFDQLQTPQQAYFVGRSFAQFQGQLADLGGPRLHETIRDFHHTPKRFSRLLEVAQNDPQGRLGGARAELEFAQARAPRVGHLLQRHQRGDFPERVTHNDTKLNNLLFDEQGLEPICIVDLDTVMPGLTHYDFGDMVRTGCALAAEDETDLEKVDFSFPLFQDLARGFLEGGRSFLTDAETEELAFSGILMTLEVGIRFLTDHLEGDPYFRIHHPDHNLERARNQFALVARLEKAESQLNGCVERLWADALRV